METLPLSQVFSKLTERLTVLEFFTIVIYNGDIPVPSHSISEIESQIFNYPTDEALKWINEYLKKVEKLIKLDESIVSAVSVEDYDEIAQEYITSNNTRKTKVKRELYESVRIELQVYEEKLNNLKTSLLLNAALENETKRTKNKNYNNIPPSELKLDMRQFALLFNYLREHKIIQYLPNEQLAPLLSHLTGFESKIRTTRGLGAISAIKTDKEVSVRKKGTTEHYNLKTVKQALLDIITEIEEDMKQKSA